EYGYKPEPIFYGDSNRYFGVELEIDGAGKDDDYATEILDIANMREDHIYIKTDGSLDDGMEIVTHPMSLEYHKEFCWEDIMHHAVRLGYRSHQTSTCGLHVHVNRDSLGENREEQDEVISRILYFVEHHWNEMLKFSRRSEYAMNRWAARYGYENSPKAIMDKAKKNYGRYVAVNLCNYHTIEFRLFRGTLKYNTLISTLELVNRICDIALSYTDDEMSKLSWSEFVSEITEPELIQYLKERSLYINEKITSEEEM
ncbi:MAG: amidoligase family protein, partial [Clostridiales bacterium]|nr:amidoligase family protein [Clostridiales bacterium]